MPELLRRLQSRLESLPDGLQAHIYRVRDVALELAGRHGIDLDQAELSSKPRAITEMGLFSTKR